MMKCIKLCWALLVFEVLIWVLSETQSQSIYYIDVQLSTLILILIFCSLVLDGLYALGSMVYHTVSIDIHLWHLYTWIICLRVYGVVSFEKIWQLFDWDWDGFVGLELFWAGSVIFELGLREVVFVVVELLWIWLVWIGYSFLVDYVIIVAFYWFGLVWVWWLLEFWFRVLIEFIY